MKRLLRSCNYLDDISFGEIQTAFSEDLSHSFGEHCEMQSICCKLHFADSIIRLHAFSSTLSSSTSVGENAHATCARTSGPRLRISQDTGTKSKVPPMSCPNCVKFKQSSCWRDLMSESHGRCCMVDVDCIPSQNAFRNCTEIANRIKRFGSSSAAGSLYICIRSFHVSLRMI